MFLIYSRWLLAAQLQYLQRPLGDCNPQSENQGSMWCVHLRSHPFLPASWCGPSAKAPRAGPCLHSTRWAWAPEPCAGCYCTSQPCCDCRMEAVSKKKKGVVLILYKQSGDLKRHKVTGFHLQVHRAFHRAPIPGTTSRQCGHTPASGEPQEPNTEKKNREKFNASPTLFLRSRTEVILMMNKCLKMYLLPQASHRRLSWYRWAQGLLCRGQSLLGQCVPVSLAGCSLASGPCQKQDKEMFTLNASGHRFTDVH